MKLAKHWPYGLFAAVTLAVGWDALLLGRTFHDVRTYRAHLGEPPEERSPLHAHRPPADRGDTVLLLPMLFRNYNEGLKRGELRLWNPQLFGGYPAYYDTMLHPFYPPHLVLHLLFPPGAAYTLALLLHLFFAGAAMFRLCRGFGRSPPAAAAAGLIWMLWGYSATWWSTGILEGVSVFGPLALLALHRTKPAVAGLAAGLAILGSHPQHAVLLLVFLTAWVLVSSRRQAPIFLAVSLGVGMAAILTRLDSLANGHRQVGGDFEMLYGSPWAVLSHLFDLAFGKAWFSYDPLVRSEFAVYAGLSGAALALAGAVRGFRDPRIRFLAIAGALALLFAFSRQLAELLMQVPLLNRSMPSRWVFIAGFCLALLAADGWDEVARLPGRVPHALAAALALPILALAAVRLPGVAVAETLIGGVLALAACLAVRAKPRAALALGLAALLFDLLPPFLHQNRAADPASLPSARGPEGRVVVGARPPDAARIWNLSVGNNLLALQGLECFAGYEAILPRAYVDYALAAGGVVAGSGRVAAFERLDSPLLGAAAVSHFSDPFPNREPPRPNPLVLPRARIVAKALAARDGREAARLLRSSGFDPRGSAIVESPPLPLAGRGGTVASLERSTDRVAFRTTSDGAALLVLADTWDEGWEAEVDGRETPILRANVMFRAVPVPAGEHTVVFRFRPACARNGFVVTLLSIAAVAGWAVKSFLASRRRGAILP